MKKLIATAMAAAMSGCVLFSSTTVDQKAALAKSATTVATAVIVQTKTFTPDVKAASIAIAGDIKTELAKVTETGYEFYKNLFPAAEAVIDKKIGTDLEKLAAKALATTVLNILDTVEKKYKVDNIADVRTIASAVIDGFLNGVNYNLTDQEKVKVASCAAQRLGVPEPEGL